MGNQVVTAIYVNYRMVACATCQASHCQWFYARTKSHPQGHTSLLFFWTLKGLIKATRRIGD